LDSDLFLLGEDEGNEDYMILLMMIMAGLTPIFVWCTQVTLGNIELDNTSSKSDEEAENKAE
jgi:hypothetical protein